MPMNLDEILRKHGYRKPEDYCCRPSMMNISSNKYKQIFVRELPPTSRYGDCVAMVVYNEPSKNDCKMFIIEYGMFADFFRKDLPIIAEECDLKLEGEKVREWLYE
jgi:hypothetical protein